MECPAKRQAIAPWRRGPRQTALGRLWLEATFFDRPGGGDQDCTKRAKLSEVVLAASSVRTNISEYVSTNSALPPNTDAVASQSSKHVASVGWDGSKISATTKGISSDVDGLLVTLTASGTASTGQIDWVCDGAVPAKYLPSRCK